MVWVNNFFKRRRRYKVVYNQCFEVLQDLLTILHENDRLHYNQAVQSCLESFFQRWTQTLLFKKEDVQAIIKLIISSALGSIDKIDHYNKGGKYWTSVCLMITQTHLKDVFILQWVIWQSSLPFDDTTFKDGKLTMVVNQPFKHIKSYFVNNTFLILHVGSHHLHSIVCPFSLYKQNDEVHVKMHSFSTHDDYSWRKSKRNVDWFGNPAYINV